MPVITDTHRERKARCYCVLACWQAETGGYAILYKYPGRGPFYQPYSQIQAVAPLYSTRGWDNAQPCNNPFYPRIYLRHMQPQPITNMARGLSDRHQTGNRWPESDTAVCSIISCLALHAQQACLPGCVPLVGTTYETS